MSFPALAPDPAIEHRVRRRRLLRRLATLALLALVVFGVLHTWQSVAGRKTRIHVATKTVTLLAAEPQGDQVHVRARLDVASPDAPTQELEALVPASTWKVTKVLWACYPPGDPAKGELRTPFDPDCTHFVTTD